MTLGQVNLFWYPVLMTLLLALMRWHVDTLAYRLFSYELMVKDLPQEVLYFPFSQVSTPGVFVGLSEWQSLRRGRSIHWGSWTIILLPWKCLCTSGFFGALGLCKLEIPTTWLLLSLVVWPSGWLLSGGQIPLLSCLSSCFSLSLSPLLSASQDRIWQLPIGTAYVLVNGLKSLVVFNSLSFWSQQFPLPVDATMLLV